MNAKADPSHCWVKFRHLDIFVIQTLTYCRIPKFSDARNFAVIHLKFKQEAKPEGTLSKTFKWNLKQ